MSRLVGTQSIVIKYSSPAATQLSEHDLQELRDMDRLNNVLVDLELHEKLEVEIKRKIWLIKVRVDV